MKRLSLMMYIICMAIVCMMAAGRGFADTFTYQGKMTEAGAPAAGPLNMAFRLYDDALAGVQVGPELSLPAFGSFGNAGEFTVDLDFGLDAFPGADRWLEVWVEGAPLTPRQPVHPTPYAMHAQTAESVIDGGLGASYAEQVDFSNAANAFTGSGAGLTNLNASNFGTGSLGAAFLPTGGTWGLGSNLDVDSGTLAIDPLNNRVGIGTSNPSQTLDVIGTMQTSGPLSGVSVKNPNNSNVSFTLGWKDNVGRIRVGGSGTGAQNGFEIQTVGDASLLRITGTGNLGIKNADPETRLHISTGSDASGSSGGYIQLGPSSGANVALDNNEIMARNNGAPATLFLQGDGGDLSILDSGGGNVGIGTASPTAQLHVVAPSGDSSVKLPAASISALETFNEMGIARRYRDSTFDIPPSTDWSTVVARTIDCPSSGFILAIATVKFYAPNFITRSIPIFLLTQNPDTTQWGSDGSMRSTELQPSDEDVVTIQNVFQVSAGLQNVFFGARAHQSFADVRVIDPEITLIFIPTAYGTVDLVPTP